jgi:hypothetical protein
MLIHYVYICVYLSKETGRTEKSFLSRKNELVAVLEDRQFEYPFHNTHMQPNYTQSCFLNREKCSYYSLLLYKKNKLLFLCNVQSYTCERILAYVTKYLVTPMHRHLEPPGP